jgi:hypothetical protein
VDGGTTGFLFYNDGHVKKGIGQRLIFKATFQYYGEGGIVHREGDPPALAKGRRVVNKEISGLFSDFVKYLLQPGVPDMKRQAHGTYLRTNRGPDYDEHKDS